MKAKLESVENQLFQSRAELEGIRASIGSAVADGKTTAKLEKQAAALEVRIRHLESGRLELERRIAEEARSDTERKHLAAVKRMKELEESGRETYLEIDAKLDEAVEMMKEVDSALSEAWNLHVSSGVPMMESRLSFFVGPPSADRFLNVLLPLLRVKCEAARAAAILPAFQGKR